MRIDARRPTLGGVGGRRKLTELTPREREVATLVAYGLTSVQAVEMHRSHAMRKLGVSSRAEIVRWALDQQLLR
jgi:two-component system response regulator NreC